MPKNRKGSRSGFDYATYDAHARGFHRGAAPPLGAPAGAHSGAHSGTISGVPQAQAAPGYYHGAYTMQPYYPPSAPAYHPAYQQTYNGYLNSGYGTWYTNAYGADGFQYMRGYDASYDAFYTDGPTVDEKWRDTYPYVPTSYLPTTQNAPDRSNIGTSRSRSGRGDTSGGETETDDEEGGREHWGSKWEFIFSCVGLSVGIGNVWRFPYLAFENGGGAFLIPYSILLIIVGKPMYLMEVALGQFSQLGPLEVWKNMSPIGRGVGFAMCTISLIVAIYYNVVMGYCLHYMFNSMRSELPWASCKSTVWDADLASCPVSQGGNCTRSNDPSAQKCQSAAEQYWEKFVLKVDQAPTYMQDGNVTAFPSFGEIGEIKWDLSICLLASWIIVFLCLAKGIKSSGKVVYFTATFPYVILLVLFGYGLTLEGAMDGVKKFFEPNFEKMKEITVWRKAAEQMFFSLSVSWGGLIMFGSYNKFRHKVHYPALIISSLDFLTSIIAGVVVFSILGHLKFKGGYDTIEEVVRGGQGLAFVVYPEAVTHIPLSVMWSILFFFMLFLLGLDSEFALLETVLTGIYDMFPKTRGYKVYVCLITCCVCYLLSIPCVSYSGLYVFDLMDTYGGGMGVLIIAIFETTVIMWIYGVGRFSDDLKFMFNSEPINFFGKIGWGITQICWSITPIILTAIFAITCVYWETPIYKGNVHYPDWVHGVGWFLILVVALQIPLIGFIMVIYYASKRNLRQVVQPTQEWGPGEKIAKQEWISYQYKKAIRCKQHPYGYEQNYAMPNYSMPYYNNAFHM